MELIEKILSEDSINEAIEKVVSNKGAAGVDSMTTAEVENYYFTHGFEIITQIKNKIYKPLPVRRVYIPKPNGKKRPLVLISSINYTQNFLGGPQGCFFSVSAIYWASTSMLPLFMSKALRSFF